MNWTDSVFVWTLYCFVLSGYFLVNKDEYHCYVQDCVTPAKSLSYLVNSRHVTLITDAELSLLKVAQLERIHFHHHHQHHHHQQQQQQRHRTSSVSVQHRSRDRSIASVPQPTPFTAFYLIIVFLSLNIS